MWGMERGLGSEPSAPVSGTRFPLCLSPAVKVVTYFWSESPSISLLTLPIPCWCLPQVLTCFGCLSLLPVSRLPGEFLGPELRKERDGSLFVLPVFCQGGSGSKEDTRRCLCLWDFYHPEAFEEPFDSFLLSLIGCGLACAAGSAAPAHGPA